MNDEKTVKLQRHFAYKYKDNPYYKHVITIPSDAVKELGWSAGDKLKIEIRTNNLILKPLVENKIEKTENLGVKDDLLKKAKVGDKRDV
jgi:bifunctional DNA-binding transcriptional regulator/antitoxin component of YhaV-PrlF toxin-antitoxin module